MFCRHCIVLLHNLRVTIRVTSNVSFVAISTIATPIVVAMAYVTMLTKCCKRVKIVAIDGYYIATKT
jgi:hypothetical protein